MSLSLLNDWKFYLLNKLLMALVDHLNLPLDLLHPFLVIRFAH